MMRRFSSHPHHPETRQHEYVALPMCPHAPHSRLSSSRSQTHCSEEQSNPGQVRRGRRCATWRFSDPRQRGRTRMVARRELTPASDRLRPVPTSIEETEHVICSSYCLLNRFREGMFYKEGVPCLLISPLSVKEKSAMLMPFAMCVPRFLKERSTMLMSFAIFVLLI